MISHLFFLSLNCHHTFLFLLCFHTIVLVYLASNVLFLKYCPLHGHNMQCFSFHHCLTGDIFTHFELCYYTHEIVNKIGKKHGCNSILQKPIWRRKICQVKWVGEGEIWHNISRWKMLQILLPKLTTIFFWCVTQRVSRRAKSVLYTWLVVQMFPAQTQWLQTREDSLLGGGEKKAWVELHWKKKAQGVALAVKNSPHPHYNLQLQKWKFIIYYLLLLECQKCPLLNTDACKVWGMETKPVFFICWVAPLLISCPPSATIFFTHNYPLWAHQVLFLLV